MGCLNRSCFENLRRTTIKSNHNLTVSIKWRLAHPGMLKNQGNVFFSFSAKYYLPANVLTSNAGILTHFLSTEIWFLLFSYFTSYKNKSSLLMIKKLSAFNFKSMLPTQSNN